jgi:chromosome transmission fidelity protein 1
MEMKDFHHPFEPYDIQRQFMTALYQSIEDGKIGIFESPTGQQQTNVGKYRNS